MIQTTTKQKKSLKALSQKIAELEMQLNELNVKRQVYITSILEGIEDLIGERYELDKDFDLREVKED